MGLIEKWCEKFKVTLFEGLLEFHSPAFCTNWWDVLNSNGYYGFMIWKINLILVSVLMLSSAMLMLCENVDINFFIKEFYYIKFQSIHEKSQKLFLRDISFIILILQRRVQRRTFPAN